MKKVKLYVLSLVSIILCNTAVAQSGITDTMVKVDGSTLHFLLMKGKGTPIIFEAGGGDDASVWKDILPTISQITGAPLIAYDRPGFGKSSVDTIVHGANHTIEKLEKAIKKMGFTGAVMCVGHSQGGIYSQLFSYRNPTLVKAAVLIDATTACFYEPGRLAATQRIINESNQKNRYAHPGIYFQGADFSNNIEIARRSPFPMSIPVIDLVSDHPPFNDPSEIGDWKRCHAEFVAGAHNRQGVTAWGCGHFIYKDNPQLVIMAISKAYRGIVNENRRKEIDNRIINYALLDASENKKRD